MRPKLVPLSLPCPSGILGSASGGKNVGMLLQKLIVAPFHFLPVNETGTAKKHKTWADKTYSNRLHQRNVYSIALACVQSTHNPHTPSAPNNRPRRPANDHASKLVERDGNARFQRDFLFASCRRSGRISGGGRESISGPLIIWTRRADGTRLPFFFCPSELGEKWRKLVSLRSHFYFFSPPLPPSSSAGIRTRQRKKRRT